MSPSDTQATVAAFARGPRGRCVHGVDGPGVFHGLAVGKVRRRAARRSPRVFTDIVGRAGRRRGCGPPGDGAARSVRLENSTVQLSSSSWATSADQTWSAGSNPPALACALTRSSSR